MNKKIIISGILAGAAVLTLTGCNIKDPEVKPDQSKIGTEQKASKIYASDYSMDLNLDADGKKLTSVVTAQIENNTDKTTDKLVFDIPSSPSFRIDKTYLGKDTSAEISSSKSDAAPGMFTIDLGDDAFEPGENLIVTMEISQDIPENNSLFGYYNFDEHSEFILSGCFPVLAEYKDGEWITESNGYKQASNYKVSFKAPTEYYVVASGNETRGEDGVTTIEAMDTNDFAIVLSNKFRSHYWSNDIITVNYYYLDKGEGYRLARDVIELRVPIGIDWLESNFTKYPWSEYDMVQIYDDSEAIAHSGLMTFGGKNLYDGVPEEETEEVKSKLASVFTGGLISQWFEKMTAVHNNPDGWMDKGITTWLDDYVRANMYDVKEDRHIDDTIRKAREEHPKEMNMKLNDSFPDEKTADIVYRYRGAEFMEDLYKALGDESMTSILREYLTQNFLKMSDTENFMSFINRFNTDNTAPVIEKYFNK